MISPRDVGELIVFELCDAADQQFGWQDDLMGGHFYTDVECSPQDYHEAWQVWPGLAKPGLHVQFLSDLGA